MSKAVISDRIYLNCEPGSLLEARLLKNLVYEIYQQGSDYPLVIKNAYRITPKVMSIPSGRIDLIPEDYIVTDKRTLPSVNLPEPKFTLRPSQQEAVDLLTDNGLVNAPVGFGKSIVGLALAYKLQTKTLIITTTTTIRDMWISEIEKHFGIKAGIMGDGKFNIDSPIVVGNIQTVSRRLDKINAEFGLVIVDEVHRSPATTFTTTLNALRARYKVGLSGTLERKDGMHCVLQDYFGHIKFIGKVENVMTPSVHLYNTGIELNMNEFTPWAQLMTKLMTNPDYKNMVEALVKHYVSIGHKVLVLADRTEFLGDLHLRMSDDSFIITGAVKGSTIRNEIMDAVAALPRGCALFATQSIFSEGVSLNELSAVVLATPINNEPLLEQICGRVQRQAKDKPEPIIIDLGLIGNTGRKHQNNRKSFYINKGWKLCDMSRVHSEP